MESAEAYVVRLAGAAVPSLAGRCYPNVQRKVENDQGEEEFLWPAVVYQGVGGDTVTAFQGLRQRTCAIRLDFRAPTFTETVRIAAAGVASIRSGGRMRSFSGPIDDYDSDVEIHRRIWTVEIIV